MGRYLPVKFFAAIIFLLLYVAHINAAESTGLIAVRERITRSLRPELRQLYSEAIAAFQSKDFQTASQRYEALRAQAIQIDDKLGIGLGLGGLGAVNAALKNYSVAHEKFTAALPYLANTANPEVGSWIYISLGEVYLQIDEPRKAVDAFSNALSVGDHVIANATDEEKQFILSVRGEVFREKASAHERLKEFEATVKNLLLAADDFEKANEKKLAAFALGTAGNLLLSTLKRPQEGIKAFSRSANLFEQVEDVEMVASTRLILGWAYLSAREYQEALAAFTSALKTAQEHSLSRVALEAQYGNARVLENTGEFKEALVRYRRLLEQLRVSETKPDTFSEAGLLMRMGDVYKLLSHYEPAAEHYLLASAKFRSHGDAAGEAEATAKVGDIFSWIGEFRIASVYYEKALATYDA